MKTKKFILAAAGILSIAGLAGCGSSDLVDQDYVLGNPGTLAAGYTSLANKNANGAIKDGKYTAGGIEFKVKETLKTTYVTEPNKDFFNYLCNTWTYNSYHYCNMVDGLVENDKYGNIVGSLALGYKVTGNEDGSQTWSFQLRENAEWVDNKTGKKVADVVAQDFVDGAKYVLDPANGSGTSSLLTGFIKGAAKYSKDKGAFEAGKEGATDPDFASVGVKAPSKYVIEYTLEEAAPYFISLLTYSPYLPVNGEYLASQGSEFGSTVNNILVNGAFRITTHDFENKMVYAKNFHYYDRDHVYVNHVERKFVPSTATVDTTRTWYEAGTIDSFTVQEDDETGWATYVSGADGKGTLKNPSHGSCNATQAYGDATFIGYFNYNRTFYEFADDAHVTSAQERKDTILAISNKNFRKGILYGLDVIAYLKRFSKSEPYNYLMRSYTNKELTSYEGKDYTDYVADVYNRENNTDVKLVGIDNGSDPIYNPTKAQEYFALAKVELAAAGVEAEYIWIDYLGSMSPNNQAYEKDMLNALEQNSNGFLKINYNVPNSSDQNTKWGSVNSNFDFSMWSGWGPDYADPNTYLHTMAIYGDMIDYTGFPTAETQLEDWELSEYAPAKYQDLVEAAPTEEDPDAKDYSKAVAAFQEDIYGEYNAMYLAGAAIVDPAQTEARYQAFAEAEYKLIYEDALIIPWYSQNGYYATVAKTIPWQAGRATYGLTSDKYKNVIVTENAITKDQRKAVTDEYDAGK